MNNLRTGLGTDLHALVPGGKPILLGGIGFKHPEGLGIKAHSDGDTLLHALIDAILGACGMDDIGTHFPDSESRFKDASSFSLLAETLKKCQCSICNVDIVVHCEYPRLGGRKQEIRTILSAALGVEFDRVNIKGKSLEGLDIFGKGQQAIYVIATVLLTV